MGQGWAIQGFESGTERAGQCMVQPPRTKPEAKGSRSLLEPEMLRTSFSGESWKENLQESKCVSCLPLRIVRYEQPPRNSDLAGHSEVRVGANLARVTESEFVLDCETKPTFPHFPKFILS